MEAERAHPHNPRTLAARESQPLSPPLADNLDELLANDSPAARLSVPSSSRSAQLYHGSGATRLCLQLDTTAFSVNDAIVSSQALGRGPTPSWLAHEMNHQRLHTALNPGLILRAPPKKNKTKQQVDDSFYESERDWLKEGSVKNDELQLLIDLGDALVAAKNAQLSNPEVFPGEQIAADRAIEALVTVPYEESLLSNTHNTPYGAPTSEYLKTAIKLAVELDLDNTSRLLNWAAPIRAASSSTANQLEVKRGHLESLHEELLYRSRAITPDNAVETFRLALRTLGMLSEVVHRAAQDISLRDLADARTPTSSGGLRGTLKNLNEMIERAVITTQYAAQAIIRAVIDRAESGGGIDEGLLAVLSGLHEMDDWFAVTKNLEFIYLSDLQLEVVLQVNTTGQRLPKRMRKQAKQPNAPEEAAVDYHGGHDISYASASVDGNERAALIGSLPGSDDLEAKKQRVSEINQARIDQQSFISEVFSGAMGKLVVQERTQRKKDKSTSKLNLEDDNETLRAMAGEFLESNRKEQRAAARSSFQAAQSSMFGGLVAPGALLPDELIDTLANVEQRAFAETINFVTRYLDAFTVHPVHDIFDDDRYLTRRYPRSLTGQLVHDCGVYALRVAYILGGLPGLDLSFNLAFVPSHVALVIMGKSVGMWVVNNNEIKQIDSSDIVRWSMTSVGDALENPYEWLIGEAEASLYFGANIPYMVVDLPGDAMNSPAALEKIWLNQGREPGIFNPEATVEVDGQQVSLVDEYGKIRSQVAKLNREIDTLEYVNIVRMSSELNNWINAGNDADERRTRREVATRVMRALISEALNEGDGQFSDIEGIEDYPFLDDRLIPLLQATVLPDESINVDAQILEIQARGFEIEQLLVAERVREAGRTLPGDAEPTENSKDAPRGFGSQQSDADPSESETTKSAEQPARAVSSGVRMTTMNTALEDQSPATEALKKRQERLREYEL